MEAVEIANVVYRQSNKPKLNVRNEDIWNTAHALTIQMIVVAKYTTHARTFTDVLNP